MLAQWVSVRLEFPMLSEPDVAVQSLYELTVLVPSANVPVHT